MYSKITFIVAIIGLAVIGVIGQGRSSNSFSSSLTLAALDAFADSESDPESEEVPSGEEKYYIYGYYLRSYQKSIKCECTTSGILKVGNDTYYGGFVKGVVYQVNLVYKRCDGKHNSSRCDTRKEGEAVSDIVDPEK